MLVERDYVVRLIRELARVLARALQLRRAGKLEEARAELEAACGGLLGVDFHTLVLLDAAAAADVLATAPRVAALARLVAERAELAETDGDHNGAECDRLYALELGCQAVRRGASRADLPDLSDLVSKVPPQRIPEAVHAVLSTRGLLDASARARTRP